MLRVAVAGTGGISRAHISAWQAMEETEIVALCDVRTEQMNNYPDVQHYTDIDEMLEKETIDILDICLPTYLHVENAIKALNKGIHVLCEKPLSLKADEVDIVYQAAWKNNVKFMTAQVIRFWPEYELLKSIYDMERYGKLLSGTMKRLGTCPGWSFGGWMKDEKRSGLVTFDLHIHDLDFLVYTFGAPKKVTCNRAKTSEQDYVNALYEFDEFFVSAEASWYAAAYPFAMGFRFQFEHAIVEFEKGKLVIFEENGKKVDLSDIAEGETGDIQLPKSNAYANEIKYFVDCILTDVWPDKVKPEELEMVIQILENMS